MMPFGCVDYDFYTNVFLGRETEDFPRLAARAGEFVDGLCRGKCRTVPERDWDLLRFAVCAVIELLEDEARMERRAFPDGATLAGETVGDYSVSYSNRALSCAEIEYLDKKKREAAIRYLSAVPALKSLFSVRSFPCIHHIR